MRVGAADEGDAERVRAEVVDVTSLAGHQPRVLLPRDPGTEQGRHVVTRLARSLRRSAARRTAVLMFW